MKRKSSPAQPGVIDIRPPHTISDAEIIAALRETRGKMGLAAQSLGMGYQTFHRRIKGSPQIQDEIEAIRQELVDATEIALEEKIKEGSVAAMQIKLHAHGKDRGYGEADAASHPTSGAREQLKGVMAALSDAALDEVIRALEAQEIGE